MEGRQFRRSRDGYVERYADAQWLRVEIDNSPACADATVGTWTQHGEGAGPFATLDLRTVRVP